jgi:DCN1-like protein 3
VHTLESNTSSASQQPVVAKSSATKSSAGNHPNKRVPSVSLKEHVSEVKINHLFNSYCNEGDDSILADGIERFCQDLDIKPDDFRILVLAWKFNANVMCCFTRQEFTVGCKKIKADSISGILARMPELLQEVKEKTAFRTFYRWAFRFALDSDAGQRTLPLDIALQLWPLVFSQNEPRILRSWLEYLQKHQSLRGIPRDTWDMFLNFTECVKDGFANYDDTEAWPSLFDNFVEYETDRQNQNVEDSSPVE